MNSVLVGMFDSQSDATSARGKLLAAGFLSSAISLSGGTPTSTQSVTSATAATEQESGIGHFFRNLFGSDDGVSNSEDAATYDEAFRRGGYGLSVTTATEIEMDKAEKILNECGAFDIDEKSEQWKKEGWTGRAAPGAVAAPLSKSAVPAGETRTLQEIDEQLQVGKRTVSRGGVRIFSRITEVPVQETVTLREEHADVQRRVVDRPATEADFAAFKEGSVEVRSSAEEAVVGKTARVVGEVEVGKTTTEHDQVISDTVRKTRVEVEQIDDVPTVTTGSATAPANKASSGTTHARGSNNLDPITGEPGAHPIGTGVGATVGGVAAGAAAGSIAGPVGTVVGAAVGAVAGGLAGKGVAEKVDPTLPRKV